MRDKLGKFIKGNNAPKTAFKKGSIPWNKGTKGVCVAWNKGKKETRIEVIKKLKTSHMGIYSGSKHPRWKGGKHINTQGYILIYTPNHPFCDKNNCVREHRLVIEQQISRYLTPKETVHHLGEKHDNKHNMLMAFINDSAHQRFHSNPDNVKPEEIIFDGRSLL